MGPRFKKLWFGSDFHAEQMMHQGMPKYIPYPDKGLYDGILLAGDMGYSRQIGKVLESFVDIADFVAYTPGNHEYWDGKKKGGVPLTMSQQNEIMAEACDKLGVHFLNNTFVDFPGTDLSIWGSPWFTDYARLADRVGLSERIGGIGDYYRTLIQPGVDLSPYDHVRMCEEAQESLLAFLKYCEELQKTPLILTHFAPSVRSCHLAHPIDDDYSAYFVTDWLDKNHQLFPRGSRWVHGHTHWNCDYQLGNVWVTTNQRGYLSETISEDTYNPVKYLEVAPK